MRAIAFVLIAVALVAAAPAIEAKGPGGSCQVQEEYVTEASVNARNLDRPEDAVQPGAHRPIECYY